jgi:hypothetical protein
MTLRRYAPMKPSAGTVIPADIRAAVYARDGRRCVGPVVGMPGDCIGGLELDHIASSGALGKKSPSVVANLATLCAGHHRERTLNGRRWRPVLLAYTAARGRP